VSGSLIDTLAEAAAALAAAATAPPGAVALPVPDWLGRARSSGALRRPIAWRNTVVATSGLRRLHVEYFGIPGEIAVIHACGFPRLDTALPIFGFDVVAGREKATGCFLDLSPTVPEAGDIAAAWASRITPRRAALGEARALPDWGGIFSDAMVAVRPRGAADLSACLALGAETLEQLLARDAPAADPVAMRDAQLGYIEGQRRNQRTRRMLAGSVGEAMADRFIADCLFPAPPAPFSGRPWPVLRPAGSARPAA
jgi:phycocyanobilin:ferredoxin oxidoreductase